MGSSRTPVEVGVLEAAEAEGLQRRAAGALQRHGLVAGDRVAFCLASSPALLVAVLGALRIGIVPVMLNPTLLPAERDELLGDCEPALAVLDRRTLEALTEGPDAELAPYPLARPMHYTSGTTGRAKGVWSGLLDDAEAAALFEEEAELWGFGRADCHLVCSPMHHSVSIRFAAGTLLRGGRVVVLSRFDAGAAAEVLRRERCTTTFVAPTALGRLLRHPASPARFDDLRLLVHAGAPCPEPLKQEAIGRCGEGVVWEFYGSTEGQFTACSSGEWSERPGTVGRARPGRRLRIDDRGVIWCHAPRHARFSYWRDPSATAEAWDADAFSVGDLGRLDDQGYLFIDGRRDDLVISGGVNVYPAEVEAVLGSAPGVDEVAVFGRADPEWGERVCAAVRGSAGEEALRRHAEDRLAPYKRPKEYHLVPSDGPELPHTSTGKLRRRAVPAWLGLADPDPGGG